MYTTKYMKMKGWRYENATDRWTKDDTWLYTLKDAAKIQQRIDDDITKKIKEDMDRAGNIDWLVQEGWIVDMEEGFRSPLYICPWNNRYYSYNEALSLQENADRSHFYWSQNTVDWLQQNGWQQNNNDQYIAFISPYTQSSFNYNEAVRIELDHGNKRRPY